MDLYESILVFSLCSLGACSIVIWLVTKNMVFNTIGLGLLGVGVGLYFGLRNLKN